MPCACFLTVPAFSRHSFQVSRPKARTSCCARSKSANRGISVRDVSYWWKNGRLALDNVSLNVAPGELAMIVGENGSGKSTMLKVIKGFLKTDIGTVTLQEPCAYVHQFPDLQIVLPTVGLDIAASVQTETDSDSPDENIGKKVAEALEMVGLVPVDDFVKTSSFRLSGGQKQRVVVAGALAMNPASFLLDEVTASMDPVNRAELIARVRSIVTKKNIAALWVTHLLEELDVADTIIVMKRGRIIAKGPRVAMMPLVYDMQDGLL